MDLSCGSVFQELIQLGTHSSLGAAAGSILKASVGAGGGALLGLFAGGVERVIDLTFEKGLKWNAGEASLLVKIGKTTVLFSPITAASWALTNVSLRSKHQFSYLDAMALEGVRLGLMASMALCFTGMFYAWKRKNFPQEPFSLNLQNPLWRALSKPLRYSGVNEEVSRGGLNNAGPTHPAGSAV